MLTTIDIPENLFQESKALASSRGSTVEQLIVESVAKYVHASAPIFGSAESGSGTLPVIQSNRPGTLDLSDFDFDDLLT